MGLLVDTSVWSLAYRRDTPPDVPEVVELRRTLTAGDHVLTTGIVLLELLRGFTRSHETILAAFEILEMVEPTREDYIAAAGIATTCRRQGVQLGTVDALIAQLAIAGDHALLTTDDDFRHAADHVDLKVWTAAG